MRHSGGLCSAMQLRLCAETAAATAAAAAATTSASATALERLQPPPGMLPPRQSLPGEPLLARLAIFLLLLLRSPRPPTLLPHLCAYLCTLATATGGGGNGGGGGGGGGGRWARLQGLLNGLASLPALSSRSELVLELALFCCEPAAATATATAAAAATATVSSAASFASSSSDPAAAATDAEGQPGALVVTADSSGGGAPAPLLVGSYLLLRLFRWRDAQPHILGATFDALAQEDLDASRRGMWCALLGALARERLYALADGVRQVDLSICLLSLPESDGRCVLAALLPLLPLQADFARQLLLLLHKLLVGTEVCARRLATRSTRP